MTYAGRMALTLLVALCLQLFAWSQVTFHTGLLALAALLVAVVLGTGYAGRRAGFGAGAVAVTQALVAFGVLVVGLVVLHGPDTLGRLVGLGRAGLAFMRTSPAPMEADAGASFLIAAFFAVVTFLADTLAVSLRQVGLAVAPLVLTYLVPAVALGTPMLFSEFVAMAVGVGLVLFAGSYPSEQRLHLPTLAVGWLTVAAVVVGSLVVVWAAAQALPSFRDRPANDPLQMNDPTLDLKRNLVSGSTDPILTYTTDGDGGVYLKLATLPAFTTGGFGLADVRVASGRFPPPPGLSGPGVTRTTQVEVSNFASEWLPVPYAPRAVDAPGRWGFAVETLDVMALAGPGRGSATQGIAYEVRSTNVYPTREEVAGAASSGGADRELTTSLPDEVPQRIRDLAAEITANAPTAGAKAQAIEAYLLSDRFVYSTAASLGDGDGIATIDDFLFGSRRGYCEQFAGAMAIMLRAVGIPSRMAVGFVPGAGENGRWTVTERDMHTWPEVWLDGWGWVSFEPTPGRGAANPDGESSSGETAAPGDGATASPTPTPTAEPTPSPTASAQPLPSGAAGGVLPVWALWLIAVLVAGLVGAGVIGGPRLARIRRHARRLAGTGDPRVDTLSAWDELRDSIVDLGIGWPDGSPRYAAERLVGSLGDDEEAVASLRALAASAERALFDRGDAYAGPGAWTEDVDRVVAAAKEHLKEGSRPRRAR